MPLETSLLRILLWVQPAPEHIQLVRVLLTGGLMLNHCLLPLEGFLLTELAKERLVLGMNCAVVLELLL